MRVGELSRRHFSSVAESVRALLLTLLNIPHTEEKGFKGWERRKYMKISEKN